MSTTIEKLALARMARVDPVPYDKRTGEEYALIRVVIDSTTINQPIPNGNLVCNDEETGEAQVYEIYSNQLDAVESLVETATEAEMSLVSADLDYHTSECSGTLPNGNAAENSRPYFPAFAASFRHIMRRDMLPFRSVEVLAKPKARAAKA
jgi:hypothetical protein